MASQRRIIITGATGTLGGHIVTRLAERGDHVIAFSRDPEKARRTVPRAAEHVQWSASMTDGPWIDVIDGADAVIHLAGRSLFTRWTDQVKKEIRHSRVDGTKHLVDAIRAAKKRPSALISGSGVGYYGASVPEPVDENSPPGNDFLARMCVEWESAALEAEGAGVRVVLVRTAPVLDPTGGLLEILTPIYRLFLGGPVGSGRQPFPWIHWQDEIGIIVWALDDASVSGPVNAVAPGMVSNREFSREFGRVLHRPSLLPAPEFGVRLIFGDAAEAFTAGQHAVPERTRELGYRFQYPALHEALVDVVGAKTERGLRG